METLIAWGFVFAGGMGALLGVFILTRRVRTPWLRSMLRCLAAVWMLLPWSIEVAEGHYAPAFVVAIFEGVFRAGGNPKPALAVLIGGTAVVLLVFLVQGLVTAVRRRKAAD